MEEQQPLATSSHLTQRARATGESIEQSAKRMEAGAVEQIKGFRARLSANVDQRRSQAITRAHSVGSALHYASENVQSDDPVVHDLLDAAGDSVERVANYLSHVDVDELRGDIESFARRRPGLFFGGALLLGLAAGRVLKAATSPSIEEEYDEGPEDERLFAGRGQMVEGGAL